MPKISIYVTDDLKRRMSAVKEPVKWSRVAADAIESKLAEITLKQRVTNMSSVVERLKATRLQQENDAYRRGAAAGEQWGRQHADVGRLERAGTFDAEVIGAGQVMAPFRWDDIVYAHVVGRDPESVEQAEVDDFWEAHRDAETGEVSEDFLRGFCDGAARVWAGVKDQL